MKERIEDIIIVGRGKNLAGETVITYFHKGDPELKRTILKKDLPSNVYHYP